MEIREPKRVVRSYVQRLVAPPERVLPLLCPVRERDWIEGWEPRVVYSASGLVEPDCVFVTAASPHDAVWMVTRLEAAAGRVEMVKISPEVTACVLRIEVAPAPHGSSATVTYCHTSLGPRGDAFVDAFTEEHYAGFMRDWERRLNHYLETGELLRLEARSAG
jgi:hypothetical protein